MESILFLGQIGVPGLVIIALFLLLLFGGKKIPELMRGLGRGMKEFKDAKKDNNNDSPKKEDN